MSTEYYDDLKEFINENKNLINQNTSESWGEIYILANNQYKNSRSHIGTFTNMMLEIGVDPASIMQYIPAWYLYKQSLTSYKIPSNVTAIGVSAFRHCSSLKSIIIPDGVTRIGDYAFNDCISLTNVTIPDSVTSIDYYAFRNCSSLTSITIPNNVTSISNGTFSGCRSLTSVTISNSVTSIGEWAFNDCRSLTTISYIGTKKQWENINKHDFWNSDYNIKSIICSDGEIIL